MKDKAYETAVKAKDYVLHDAEKLKEKVETTGTEMKTTVKKETAAAKKSVDGGVKSG